MAHDDKKKFGLDFATGNEFTKLDIIDAEELRKTMPVKGDTEAAAHQEVQADQNPHLWQNMNKGQKAALILGSLGTIFTAYNNPELAWQQQQKLFGKDDEWETKRVAKIELMKERAHELATIDRTVAGRIEVQKLSGEQAVGMQETQLAHDTTALGRKITSDETLQANEIKYRGDAALLTIFGEKMMQGIRIRAEDVRQGKMFAHQTSTALLADQRERVRDLELSLRTTLGPGSELIVLDTIGRIEPFILHGGDFPDLTPDMVEALDKISADVIYQRDTTLKSAQLENLISARKVLELNQMGATDMMTEDDPRFQMIASLSGMVHSLATPEDIQMAQASLLTTPEGIAVFDHLATLQDRKSVPTSVDVSIVGQEFLSMQVPLSPVVARELLFNAGARLDDVDRAMPLPEGYLDPDPLDRTPDASREDKIYGHVIEPALEYADHVDANFGRAVRVWLEREGTEDVRSDQDQIWRIIKNYAEGDAAQRKPLLDFLYGAPQIEFGRGALPMAQR